ncbi:MAG: MYXO-CTERM sorting domain-containing protein [Congregibacter sp.]
MQHYRFAQLGRQLGIALTLASCSSLANAGLMIDSINVKMTNTTFSARSSEERREIDNARAFDNARSAFDSSFSEQGFCDLSLDALVNVTAQQTCGGTKRNYGAQYTITGTNIGVTEFEFGLDWGRGGFISFASESGTDIVRRTDDVWWSRNWNNSDVIGYSFAEQGDFTLTLLGFEGCCDGINSVQYRSAAPRSQRAFSNRSLVGPQIEPLEWQALSVNSSSTSQVPVPGSLSLLALGAGLLLRRRRG